MGDVSIFSTTTLRWAVGLEEPMRPAMRKLRTIAIGKLAKMRAERLKAALHEPSTDDATTEFLRQVSLAGIAKRAAQAAGAEPATLPPAPPPREALTRNAMVVWEPSKIAAFTKT